jgi:hypothetical protein
VRGGQPGRSLIAELLETWRALVPPLSDTHVCILDFFVRSYPRAFTPYEVAREVRKYSMSTVYRAVKHLAESRFVLLASSRGYAATVKGPISLLALTKNLEYLNYIRNIWSLNVDSEMLIAYLILLGRAIRHFGFNICEAFICNPAASTSYVLTYLTDKGTDPADPAVLDNSMKFLSRFSMWSICLGSRAAARDNAAERTRRQHSLRPSVKRIYGL